MRMRYRHVTYRYIDGSPALLARHYHQLLQDALRQSQQSLLHRWRIEHTAVEENDVGTSRVRGRTGFPARPDRLGSLAYLIPGESVRRQKRRQIPRNRSIRRIRKAKLLKPAAALDRLLPAEQVRRGGRDEHSPLALPTELHRPAGA